MHITFLTYLSCIYRIATSNFSCILWHIKNYQDKLGSFYKAERVGFEPTRPLGQTVFKTASLWPLRYLSIYLLVCRFRITSATRCILSQLFTVVNTFFKLFLFFCIFLIFLYFSSINTLIFHHLYIEPAICSFYCIFWYLQNPPLANSSKCMAIHRSRHRIIDVQ